VDEGSRRGAGPFIPFQSSGRGRVSRHAVHHPPGCPPAGGHEVGLLVEQDDIERIRLRAYEIREAAGPPAGRDHARWEQAQAELAAKDAYGLDHKEVVAMREGAGQVEDEP